MSPPSDVKVVLLGTEYCGKSSLVERYLHDRFRGENSYQNTVGAAYGSKLFEINVTGSAPRALIMGIWDTAGSERYQSMSRLYYRSARAAILCFDITCRESWAKVQFWKKEVQRHERLCRIYLCATKMDKLLPDQADGTEGHAPAIDGAVVSRFAQESEAALFHTSSKTGEQVGALFHQIAWDFVQDPINFPSEYDSLVDLNRRESRRDKFQCCSFF